MFTLADFVAKLIDCGWPKEVVVSSAAFWHIFRMLPPGNRSLMVTNSYRDTDEHFTFPFFLTKVVNETPAVRMELVDLTKWSLG